jgi:hypothetical protein
MRSLALFVTTALLTTLVPSRTLGADPQLGLSALLGGSDDDFATCTAVAGTYELVFTGTDEANRTRTATLTVIVP